MSADRQPLEADDGHDTVTKRPVADPFPDPPPYACRTWPPGLEISLPQRPHSLFTMSLMSSPNSRPCGTDRSSQHPGCGKRMFQIAGSTSTPSGGCRFHGAKFQRSGGARRDRTDDLMLAKHALSQLSYGPKGSSRRAERPVSWWAWDDSNVRPHPYQGCALTT